MQDAFILKGAENKALISRPGVWLGVVLLAMALSVVQDYLFSQFRQTGFYLTESLLYNTIWIFLIPLAFLQLRILKYVMGRNVIEKIGLAILSAAFFTLIHILIFSCFFVVISHFVFYPGHHFYGIFSGAISNQFYVLALFYGLLPVLNRSVAVVHSVSDIPPDIPEKIQVRTGLRTISLEPEQIEWITTEKPYTVIHAAGQKYVDERTLKDLAGLLPSEVFLRVHRSVIINKSCVKEIISRQNGDYDCLLNNGKSVRLSRHYRQNWENLLH